ncbi:MAG: Adenosylhomocysteinase [Nitrospira sp.]|nr:MAG: Adenosylhomocysteinase [Nitrospira sp.]
MAGVGALVPGGRHVEWADTLHELPREQVRFYKQQYAEPDHDRPADEFQPPSFAFR